MTNIRRCTFEPEEKDRQTRFFLRELPDEVGFGGADYRLKGNKWRNIAPAYAALAQELFENCEPRIESHTHANHALSSQMCCVNFLLPMADRPELLNRWVEHVLGLHDVAVEPIERRLGQDWYLAFEWFSPTDYLNEANRRGQRPRGSQSTSVDAALSFRQGGDRHLLLIEWKYTERYGGTRSAKERAGDPTRDGRYTNIWKRPHGPIRADAPLTLQDFYLNPWYQLLRQQMLAYHAETDPLSGYDRATVLHISPARNHALKRVNGETFRALEGETLFEVFTGLLDQHFRDRFRPITIESAFTPLAGWGADWLPYLRDRYSSLFLSEEAA